MKGCFRVELSIDQVVEPDGGLSIGHELTIRRECQDVGVLDWRNGCEYAVRWFHPLAPSGLMGAFFLASLLGSSEDDLEFRSTVLDVILKERAGRCAYV